MPRDLKAELEEIMVSLAAKGKNTAPLPPHLWEPLRIRLQNLYRHATGETKATVHVENIP